MSFHGQALLSQDGQFRDRVAACAATQPSLAIPPTNWADNNIWLVSAAPGFADKYTYALDTGVQNPGADGAVIPDADILAAVQEVMSRQTAQAEAPAYVPPEPEPTPHDGS